MQPNIKKHKHLKLGPSRLLWRSEPEETFNPAEKRKAHRRKFYGTFCYRVPFPDSKHLETVWVDGVVVWERHQGSTFASAILGGGGRFVWRRKWYAKKVVAIELELKDLPLKNEDHTPEIHITVRM